MSNDWKWGYWEEVRYDKEIQGPPETNNYNGAHGLKPGVAKLFNTVIQCIFECNTTN